MSEVIPLVLLFTAWIPLAALVAWAFERRPRPQLRRIERMAKPH
jgi:hypothetical protein